ncbi:MAG: hypothetical protein V3V39_09850 [Desulfobacterales bacterium]
MAKFLASKMEIGIGILIRPTNSFITSAVESMILAMLTRMMGVGG